MLMCSQLGNNLLHVHTFHLFETFYTHDSNDFGSMLSQNAKQL